MYHFSFLLNTFVALNYMENNLDLTWYYFITIYSIKGVLVDQIAEGWLHVFYFCETKNYDWKLKVPETKYDYCYQNLLSESFQTEYCMCMASIWNNS